MQEHDIVVISPESEYEWKSKTKEDVLLLKSYMESYQLQLGIGSKDYIIRCNSSKYPEEDYRKIRYILKVILEQYVDPQKILVINSLYYTLWECLKTQFSASPVSHASANPTIPFRFQPGQLFFPFRAGYGNFFVVCAFTQEIYPRHFLL